MTRLRDGRAELHDRLNAAAHEGRNGKRALYAYWSRRELCDLIAEARDALLTCPHETCAYCFTVEKEAR